MSKIRALYRSRILTPSGIWFLTGGFRRHGKTLMTLLHYASKKRPNQVLTDAKEQLSYSQLYRETIKTSTGLSSKQVIPGSRVLMVCKTNLNACIGLFALSRCGAHIYLANSEMSPAQIRQQIELVKPTAILVDEPSHTVHFKFSDIDTICISELRQHPFTGQIRLKKVKAGNIVVMTGGTTGQSKAAGRSSSTTNFLNPLAALINQMQLHRFNSVYIPLPLFHGFGLAALIVSILLCAEIYLDEKFDPQTAALRIKEHEIKVLTVVPLMLHRLMPQPIDQLKSVKRVLCGGAALSPKLATTCRSILPNTLYNLYGTSEAGFCIIGDPHFLAKHPNGIGKSISGAKLKIANPDDQGRGELMISSKWIMNGKERWIGTGDLAHIAPDGGVFLHGRTDSMIVSGGENVYPADLENCLIKHPQMRECKVVGVVDDEFGQRLRAFVSLEAGTSLQQPELKLWLKPRIARFQMPREIIFLEEFPRTSIGKVDLKALRNFPQN